MQIAAPIHSLTSAAALSAVEAAVSHGRSLAASVVAAAVGASGDLLSCLRADGAYLPSIEIARDKAYTAAVFGTPTHELGKAMSSNKILFEGISQRPGVVLFAGGIPIVIDAQVVGAIGVSGGSEDEDLACAKAALAALGLR
nr:B170 [uncultured bacterium]